MHRVPPAHLTRGLHPAILIAGYVALALAPIGIARWQDLPSRGFFADFSSGLALAGLAMVLMQFVTAGRFEGTTGRIGIDLSMRAHQLAARLLVVLLIAHPLLAALGPGGADAYATAVSGLFLSPRMLTGVAAWVLLTVLVLLSVARDRMPFRYEVWRASHGVGALLVAGLGVHHAVSVGAHASDAMTALWLVGLVLAMAALATVYVFTPLLLLRRPWRIHSVHNVGDRLWELALEPAAVFPVRLTAGQFFWLTLARSPFNITEHPFSATSSAAQLPRMTFLIKESGDFTSRVGALPAGARAYCDGPRGIFTLTGRTATGIGLIAGGVGIAPILGILRQLHADRDPRPVRLLFGNRHARQVVYADELEGMTRDFDFRVRHVLSEPPAGWGGGVGIVDQAEIEGTFDDARRTGWVYFVCGPPAMMDGVEKHLLALGIPAANIVTERFRYR